MRPWGVLARQPGGSVLDGLNEQAAAALSEWLEQYEGVTAATVYQAVVEDGTVLINSYDGDGATFTSHPAGPLPPPALT